MMNIIERRTLNTLNETLEQLAEDSKAGKIDDDAQRAAFAKMEMARAFAESATDSEIKLEEGHGYVYTKEPTGTTTEKSVLELLQAGLDRVAMLHGALTDDAEKIMMESILTAQMFAQAMTCRFIELDEENGFRFADR